MSKQITFNQEGRSKLKAGVDILANSVKVTLGPKGRNVVIQQNFGSPIITKDGVTVAKHVEIEDQLENLGAQLVKEVASKTAESAGDGTTTATVLAQAIVEGGSRYLAAGVNPVELKKGLDKGLKHVIEVINSLAEHVTNNLERIKQIATISANGDETIGELITEAIRQVTTDGIIRVESSKSSETYLKVDKGMQFSKGLLSTYFVTDEEKQTCTLTDPIIFLCAKRVASLHEIRPILDRAQKIGSPLLIIAEEFEPTAVSGLVINKLNGALNAVAVKAPAFGDAQRSVFEDIAVLVGAGVYGDTSNTPMEKVAFGRCESVLIDKDSTLLVNGGGSPEAIQDRVDLLKSQREQAVDPIDKADFNLRIAKLTGGVASIRVGAHSEVEMGERKYRVEDAVHATKAAIQEGIVPGGGLTLLMCDEGMVGVPVSTEGELSGIRILRQALREPAKVIAQNAGFDGNVIIERTRNSNKRGADLDKENLIGFNAEKGLFENLKNAGVIDPAKVVRVAIENAVSVGSLILTTECAITSKVKPVPLGQAQIPYGG